MMVCAKFHSCLVLMILSPSPSEHQSFIIISIFKFIWCFFITNYFSDGFASCNSQLLVGCKIWHFLFVLNVYLLILWGLLLMKVQKSLVLFRYWLIFFLSISIINCLKAIFYGPSGRKFNILIYGNHPTDSILLETSFRGSINTTNIFWLLCNRRLPSFQRGSYMSCFLCFSAL